MSQYTEVLVGGAEVLFYSHHMTEAVLGEATTMVQALSVSPGKWWGTVKEDGTLVVSPRDETAGEEMLVGTIPDLVFHDFWNGEPPLQVVKKFFKRSEFFCLIARLIRKREEEIAHLKELQRRGRMVVESGTPTFGQEVQSDLVGKRMPTKVGNPVLKVISNLDPAENSCHPGLIWVRVVWGYDEAPRELYSYVCACGKYL